MPGSAVASVFVKIGGLVTKECSLLCAVTGEVEFLKDELERLQAFLEGADNVMRYGDASMVVCVKQLRDASYEAENIIDAAEHLKKRNMLKKGFMGAISRYARLPCDLVALHKVNSQIRRLRRRISEIKNSMPMSNIASLVIDQSEDIDDDLLVPLDLEDVVVGFEIECRDIVQKLVDEENKNLSVVSLVAMGGGGKTTLARKVYNSSRVKEHFGKVAWVTVSQKFKGIDLLKDIMRQITGPNYDSMAANQMQENDVRKNIHDFLLRERYLVVLDDVWATNTWERLNRRVKVFPDSSNGSKILLTTRKNDVAHHIQMPTYVHDLKPLSEEKSWELFSSKAIPSYKRSTICDQDQFEDLGRKLARKCAGLPLALTVLGGYLSKNLKIEAWSDLLLNWIETEDGQMMWHILGRSYNDLSNKHLKSCFLYLASFPEDYPIPVEDLIELWIAESFIPHTTRTLRKTAQRYLSDLAQRNLVQLGEKTFISSITYPAIRIHDILRDWCIEEARRDGFLRIIDKTGGQVGASSSDTMTSYRSCFHNCCDDGVLQATPNLRTFMGFGLSRLPVAELRFVKVIHLENSNLYNLMSICGCIHLKYLRLRKCDGLGLPSSIGELLSLETVDLRGTRFQAPKGRRFDCPTPVTAWAIHTLRHLYISVNFPPRSGVGIDPIPILEKLPCLAVLHLSDYYGPVMSISAQGFPLLEELALKSFQTEWRIESGAMPSLYYLYLESCQMSKLPDGLLHLPSFKKLAILQEGEVILDDTWKELERKGCKGWMLKMGNILERTEAVLSRLSLLPPVLQTAPVLPPWWCLGFMEVSLLVPGLDRHCLPLKVRALMWLWLRCYRSCLSFWSCVGEPNPPLSVEQLKVGPLKISVVALSPIPPLEPSQELDIEQNGASNVAIPCSSESNGQMVPVSNAVVALRVITHVTGALIAKEIFDFVATLDATNHGSSKTIGCLLKEKAIRDKKSDGASTRPVILKEKSECRNKKSGAIGKEFTVA